MRGGGSESACGLAASGLVPRAWLGLDRLRRGGLRPGRLRAGGLRMAAALHRQGPGPGRRRRPGDAVAAGRIEPPPGIVGERGQQQALAEGQRDLAGAGMDRPHIGIGIARADLRPGRPGIEGDAPERIAPPRRPVGAGEAQHRAEHEGIEHQPDGADPAQAESPPQERGRQAKAGGRGAPGGRTGGFLDQHRGSVSSSGRAGAERVFCPQALAPPPDPGPVTAMDRAPIRSRPYMILPWRVPHCSTSCLTASLESISRPCCSARSVR